MRKYFNRLLLLLVLMVAASVPVMAQQMPPIPVDPNVRIGRLDNGLTYYIRHNEYPKNQADYYIAQKVGSILEEDNQRGLAHFLEHMCFNGTKNFPGNEIVSWLETVGVKFGRNLNAYTSVDETVYNICEVPTARESVQDSCLLILHDWADGLLLDGEEIDKERAVIHEEWRSTNVGQQRILEALLPVMYPDSKYAYRLPIGTMEVVDNFPHQALRDYYETWYRPDQQGIIVVGDIDVDRIEAKIKEIFSDIKMPENPKERKYFPVGDNKEPIFAIGKDKEQDLAIVQIMFRSDIRPDSLKGNLDYLVELYAIDMIESMLRARFNDMMSKPDAPFAMASANDGDLLAKTKDAFNLLGIPKGNDLMPTFEAIYREGLRAQRGGFTASEYGRARSEYLSQLENRYKNRNSATSTSLVQGYVRNFIDNEPIPGIENEYQIMSMLANQIPVEALNMAMAELMPDSNVVVLAMLPDNGEFVIPTEAQLAEAMKKVAAENIEAYVDDVKSEPLIANLPKPGTIVSTADDKEFGAIVWTLSNGAKVVVKHTDFKDDEVIFGAVAKGGTSGYGSEYDLDLRYLPVALTSTGLGSYTSADLQKYMAGKQASVNVSLSDYDRSLSGRAVPKDIPTLMELIYMTFTGFNLDAAEFEATQNLYTGYYQNQEANPQFQFSKRLMEALQNSPRHYALDVNTIKNANRDNILNIVKSQLANAGEYTFYFVGNVDVEALKPLVEQYIASIPGKAVADKKITTVGLGLKTGSATEQVTQKMDTPQTFAAVIACAEMPYSSKNHKLASMAAQILSARLVKIVREDEGAVYSINASGALSRIGDTGYNAVIESVFPMKPEMKDKVLEIIAGQFDDMTSNITAEELNKVKEYMVKDATANLKKNTAWEGAMEGYAILPVNTFTNAVDEINAITPDDVKAYMKEFMKQNNYRVFIMDPEVAK
ncbi:MAG: insulinase family protein [Muribaculum sp.]